MPTTLPVPIEFGLPDGWRAAPPDEVGAQGVAFIALHPQPDAGFTANITVDGDFRPDGATLADMADESVERLRRAAESVTVTSRRELGSEAAPGLAQRVALSAVAGGVRRDLVQSHVYLAVLDLENPHRRAVIRLVLTSTAAQEDGLLDDFREFLRTVSLDTGEAA
ncbi:MULTISPECIES: hypothetical protein [unclassified Streptomyces]|uniref:hypothetical protein n=1 Tax=unclassified Streptomyces TaxID=2593676 RepID=UPI0006B1D54D|nr:MULTISPECIES: hypothetical protein [unclassified Streptomyces]KOY53538.1 hypothetical protein ADK59_35125 [Streptomyces sp. XY332]TDU77619.1 hypothetical protein EDD91_4378 [Streptomyces sp. KS 21]THA37017.1 hypothetical protein E6W17_23625 [Streptomyces sp. A1547]